MADDILEPTSEALKECLITMAVESWRIGRVTAQLVEKVSPMEQSRHTGQLRWFRHSVDGALALVGLRLVNIEGDRYDAGMAATPLNIEEFSGEDELVVEQMLEPIIMGPHGIVRTGTVVLRKAVV